ncbi:hypothetical protein N7470_000857 [Penicillium chermesinum]|nr:hypothetical protein N7470_000857 [Penicillium chermesinum]
MSGSATLNHRKIIIDCDRTRRISKPGLGFSTAYHPGVRAGKMELAPLVETIFGWIPRCSSCSDELWIRLGTLELPMESEMARLPAYAADSYSRWKSPNLRL